MSLRATAPMPISGISAREKSSLSYHPPAFSNPASRASGLTLELVMMVVRHPRAKVMTARANRPGEAGEAESRAELNF